MSVSPKLGKWRGRLGSRPRRKVVGGRPRGSSDAAPAAAPATRLETKPGAAKPPEESGPPIAGKAAPLPGRSPESPAAPPPRPPPLRSNAAGDLRPRSLGLAPLAFGALTALRSLGTGGAAQRGVTGRAAGAAARPATALSPEVARPEAAAAEAVLAPEQGLLRERGEHSRAQAHGLPARRLLVDVLKLLDPRFEPLRRRALMIAWIPADDANGVDGPVVLRAAHEAGALPGFLRREQRGVGLVELHQLRKQPELLLARVRVAQVQRPVLVESLHLGLEPPRLAARPSQHVVALPDRPCELGRV
eukprot:CAMPEP_0172593172 /NCGR_PEP_ID=MMETSP1068-20121228/12341_1 /TAXON_ID=35684 /ORGANISM="Pseudopedinella elastica, Strain CCMP716" /LENGTH=303 /DNA_ID=CAMNT_0013390569 /DNA_START=191 /DNA_END=1098 /DNA_ORIENTATION=+